jgi:hypothetical protein
MRRDKAVAVRRLFGRSPHVAKEYITTEFSKVISSREQRHKWTGVDLVDLVDAVDKVEWP